MRNMLVETTGAFMLMTRFGEVNAFRPSVVKHTQEINQFVSQKQITVLENELPETADDAEFASFYIDHDKDWEAALENYIHFLNGTGEDSSGGATPGDTDKDDAPTGDADKDDADKDDADKDDTDKDDTDKDDADKDDTDKDDTDKETPTPKKTRARTTKASS